MARPTDTQLEAFPPDGFDRQENRVNWTQKSLILDVFGNQVSSAQMALRRNGSGNSTERFKQQAVDALAESIAERKNARTEPKPPYDQISEALTLAQHGDWTTPEGLLALYNEAKDLG